MHPKVQFPAKPHCADCYDAEMQDWKLAKVFEFLQMRYGAEKIVRAPKPAEIGDEKGEAVGLPPPKHVKIAEPKVLILRFVTWFFFLFLFFIPFYG